MTEWIRTDHALALVAEACERMVSQAVSMADGKDEAAFIEDRMRDAIPSDALAARKRVRDEALEAERDAVGQRPDIWASHMCRELRQAGYLVPYERMMIAMQAVARAALAETEGE